MSDTQERIEQLVKNNAVLLFMKGTASFPQCGFSARAILAEIDGKDGERG